MASNPFIVEAPSIQDQYLRGLQIGNEMGNQDFQRAQMLQQIKAQQTQQEAYANDLHALSQNPNPTAKDFAMMQLKYPQQAQAVKDSWATLSPELQSQRLSDMGQVHSAMVNGRPDIAVALLEDRAKAAENAGDMQTATTLRHMAEVGRVSPETLRTATGSTLSAIVGPDKYASTYESLGKESRAEQEQPYNISSKASDAAIKGAEASVAGDKAQLGVQGQAEDVKTKILQRQLDVKKTQLEEAKTDTERMKVQADIDKLQLEMGQAQQGRAQTAQSTIDTAQTGLDTVDRLMTHPGFKGATGTAGGIKAWFNSTDAHDFRNQLEVLKSQAFLSGIQKMKAAGGAGSLSDAEGSKIENAIANLDPDTAPERLMDQLAIVKQSLVKLRNAGLASPDLPTSGGGFVMQSKKYGNITEGTINRLMRDHPGSTRDQVINYLNQQ